MKKNDPASKNFSPLHDNFIERFFFIFSKYFTPFFIRNKFSANSVTFISGVFGLAGSSLILFDRIETNILSFIFINLFVILDLVDGDIARHTQTSSLFGRWFDLFFDKLNEVYIIFILIYMSFQQSNDNIFLILGYILISMHFAYQYIIIAELYWFNNISKNDMRSHGSQQRMGTTSLGNKLLVHLTLKHSTLFFLSSIFILIGKYSIAVYILTLIATFSVFLSCLRNFIKFK